MQFSSPHIFLETWICWGYYNKQKFWNTVKCQILNAQNPNFSKIWKQDNSVLRRRGCMMECRNPNKTKLNASLDHFTYKICFIKNGLVWCIQNLDIWDYNSAEIRTEQTCLNTKLIRILAFHCSHLNVTKKWSNKLEMLLLIFICRGGR